MNPLFQFKKYILIIFIPLILQQANAQKAGIELITIISPPIIADTINLINGERYLDHQDAFLYTVNLWSGIQIHNIQNLTSPQFVNFLRTKDMAHHVKLYEDKLFIANESEGVIVYDVSDKYRPSYLTRIKTPGEAFWVDLKDNYLYVALGINGFCIVDISNLSNAEIVFQEQLESWIWSVYIHNNELYVSAKQSGLMIYNISNPLTPNRITHYQTRFQTIQLQIENDLAYIADGPGGMLILDISDLNLPHEVSRFETSGFSQHVFKSGNYVYLSNREQGLFVVNVQNPSKPYLETKYKPESETYCAIKKDIYVYLATNNNIEILRHNNQPVLEPLADGSLDENANFSIQLRGYDPDGDPIIFEAENLPEGSEFDTRTGLFSWQPTFEQSGFYPNIILKLREETANRLTASDTISLTVNNVNQLPILPSITNTSIEENRLLTIQINKATDPDSEDIGKLTYRAENLPNGATFDSDSLKFNWLPTYDQSGTYFVDFVVSDPEGGSDRNPVKIDVIHIDRPPTLEPIENYEIDEGNPLNFKIVGNEPDKEDLSKIQYDIQNLPDGATLDTKTGQFNWIPTYDQSGDYSNLKTIMSAGSLKDTTTFSILVNHVNRAPELTDIQNVTIDENSSFTLSIKGSDPDVEDTGQLTFYTENLPSGATFDTERQLFSWTPTFEQSGVYQQLTFSVRDSQGLYDSKIISITVNHINREPILDSVPAQIVDENNLLEYQLSSSDPDREDQDKLVYSAENLPQGAILNSQDGLFSWTPNFEQAGEYPIVFIVSDGNLANNKASTITVNQVNRKPVLNEISNKSTDENLLLSFKIEGTDPDVEDTGKYNFSANNLPEGAIFNPETQLFSWTPTFDQSGLYEDIAFTVKDPAGLSDTKSISITVNHVNRPPSIERVAPLTSSEMVPINITLSASDPDKEDQGLLRFKINNLPQGATINDASGEFNWTPTYDQAGQYSLSAQVSDSENLTAETTINLIINNVNRAPVIEPLEVFNGREDSSLEVQLVYSDPDKEDLGKLKLTTPDLPEGVSVDRKKGIIKWKPNYKQGGSYTFTYSVSDDANSEVTATLQLEIENVNRPPALKNIRNKKIKVGESFSFTLEAEDPDSEDVGNLNFSANNLPEGAIFNQNSGNFSWTPDENQTGLQEVTFSVSDIEGLSDQKTIQIEVEAIAKSSEEPE